MSKRKRIVCSVYYGGETYMDDDEGFCYRGCVPKTNFWTCGGGIVKLKYMISKITAWDLPPSAIKINARYPTRAIPRPYFQLLEVEDEDTLKGLEEECCRSNAICRGLELFVEEIPITNFTELLNAMPSQQVPSIPQQQQQQQQGPISQPQHQQIPFILRSQTQIPPLVEQLPQVSDVFTQATQFNTGLEAIPEYFFPPQNEPPHMSPLHEIPSLYPVHNPHHNSPLHQSQPPPHSVHDVSSIYIGGSYDWNRDFHVDYDLCVMTNNPNAVIDDGDGDYREDDNVPPTTEIVVPAYGTATIADLSEADIAAATMSRPPTFGSYSQYNIDKGAVFSDKGSLLHAVSVFNIKQNRAFKIVGNNKEKYYVKCRNEDCKWYFRAICPKDESFWIVRKHNGPHTCTVKFLTTKHPHLTSKLIAAQVFHLVKSDISLKISTIQENVLNHFKYQVSYKKAWHAKQHCLKILFGGFKESYARLVRFLAAVVRSNPGSVVKWCVTPNSEGGNTFDKVFWAYKPCIDAIEHCRPVMSIDGTHLYGKYKGTILIATALDANEQLLPFAYALVPLENNDSWGWFMECIRAYVSPEREWCVVSDRHPSILNAMTSPRSSWREPRAYHRYCIRHFGGNCQKEYGKKIGDKVKLIGYMNQERKYVSKMESLKKIKAGAFEWCSRTPLEKWTLLKDEGKRYGMMTTNISEVFNNVLKGVRSLPVTAIAELTFFTLRNYFDVRRENTEKLISAGGIWSQTITKKLEERRLKSNLHKCDRFSHVTHLCQITTYSKIVNGRERGLHKHTVNLSEGTCSCNKPTLEKIPCSHIMAACASRGYPYDSLVNEYFTLSKQARTWEPNFYPIPDEAYWPSEIEPKNVVPDETTKKTKKGRPNSSRIYNEMDIGDPSTKKKATCSKCGQSGHNKRTCTYEPPNV